jgi:hypothetical protein
LTHGSGGFEPEEDHSVENFAGVLDKVLRLAKPCPLSLTGECAAAHT